jgi:hypothetical protein
MLNGIVRIAIVALALAAPPLRRQPPLRRSGIGGPKVRAHPAQRARVAGRGCIVCGARPCDPAHLIPQWYRACCHAEGVIPLCRRHHRAYDWGGLNILGWITDELAEELAHALMHVRARELLRGLQGGGWGDPEDERSGRGGTTRERRPQSW